MTPGESHNEWYQYYCSIFYVFKVASDYLFPLAKDDGPLAFSFALLKLNSCIELIVCQNVCLFLMSPHLNYFVSNAKAD